MQVYLWIDIMKDKDEKQPTGKLNPMTDEMKLLKLVELYRFIVENTVDVIFQVTLAGKII